MKTSRWVWGVFGACVVLVLVALAGLTDEALRLARADARTQALAAFDENVRLALWRMDASAAPLMTAEVGRPYFAYAAFEPVGRPYPSMLNTIAQTDVLSPSPLLTQDAATAGPVLLYFQVDPEGHFSSPQAPTGQLRRLAEGAYTTAAQIDVATHRLSDLAQRVDVAALRRAAQRGASPEMPPVAPLMVRFNGRTPSQQPQQAEPNAPGPMAQAQEPAQEGDNEFRQRTQSYKNITANAAASNNAVVSKEGPAKLPPDSVSQGMLQPCWQGDELLLVRQVQVQGRLFLQGCWLDWAALRVQLTSAVADLLPQAHVAPTHTDPAPAPPGGATTASDNADRDATLRMATLPVRLVPGPVPVAAGQGVTPLHLALLVAWAAVLAAGLAVGVLLHSALGLSERRAAFVAAVTHELRTPLTTLRMYSEMLVEGMVPQEAQRQEYVRTLHVEADRLSHLVENVLAYARLERGSARARHERITVAALLEQFAARLGQRARQAGLDLVINVPANAGALVVSTDVTGVEQILFNLVDNACKHAQSATDKRLTLGATRTGERVEIRVCDRGPGIVAGDVRRLFRPFSRGNGSEMARPTPGVGLGLALSRRLARNLAGDLRDESPAGGGACFVLTLRAEESLGVDG